MAERTYFLSKQASETLQKIKDMLDRKELEVISLQGLFQQVFQDEVRNLGLSGVPETINREIELKLSESKIIVKDTTKIIKPA